MSKSWSISIGPQEHGDDRPLHLIVKPFDGSLVTREDVEWLAELIKNSYPTFKDICKICNDEIDSTMYIEGVQQAVCGQIHASPCTYGGCMPDFEYRRDNLRIGQKLWEPLRKS